MFVPCLICFHTFIFVIVMCKVGTNCYVCRAVPSLLLLCSADICWRWPIANNYLQCVCVYILSIRSSGKASEEKGRVHIELTVTLTPIQTHAICMMKLHCLCNSFDLNSTV